MESDLNILLEEMMRSDVDGGKRMSPEKKSDFCSVVKLTCSYLLLVPRPWAQMQSLCPCVLQDTNWQLNSTPSIVTDLLVERSYALLDSDLVILFLTSSIACQVGAVVLRIHKTRSFGTL